MLTQDFINTLKQIRNEVREYKSPSEVGGQCATIAEEIFMKYNYQETAGYLITKTGKIIEDHWWNYLPDGSILDATVDQFSDEEWEGDIIVITPDNPMYYYYIEY